MRDQAESLRRKVALSRQKQAKTISIISGKGGVGKSSTAVNFALELTRKKYKVLIIDLDIGMGNIEVMLGLHAERTLVDLLEGQQDISDVIASGPNNLSYISGGSGLNDLFSLTDAQKEIFFEKYHELASEYDFILFDMGAGISRDSLFFILASDECIVITTPEPTALTDAYSMIKLLIKHKGDMSINIVMNRCKSEKEGMHALEQFEQIIHRFLSIRIRKLGILLEDRIVPESIMKQSPYMIWSKRSKIKRSMEHLTATYLSYARSSQPGPKTFIEKLRSFFQS